MNFNLEMEKRQEKITGILEYYLPKEEGFQKTVLEAMNYSMRAGGKRLRPLLMLETYRMFGGEGQIIEPFMAAMEMIHTHSLIHDDLPALDNDEYRRGHRTTHIVYGEAMQSWQAMHCSIMPMRRQCVPLRSNRAIRRSGKHCRF